MDHIFKKRGLAAIALLAVIALIFTGCFSIKLNVPTETPEKSSSPSPSAPSGASNWDTWRKAADAAMPALIPTADIFSPAEYTDPQVSPDGRYVLYRHISDTADDVMIMDMQTGKTSPVSFPPEAAGIPYFFWAEDSQHVIMMIDNMGDENYGIYSIDISQNKSLTVYHQKGVSARFVGTHPTKKNILYISLNDRDSQVFDLYQADITTGKTTSVMQNPGTIMGWYFDRQGKLRAVSMIDDQGGEDVYYTASQALPTTYNSSDWKSIVHWSYEDSTASSFFGFSEDGKRVFLKQSAGRNTACLEEMDLASGTVKVIAEDPVYDVGGYWLDLKKDQVTAVQFMKERSEWVALDDNMKQQVANLKAIADGDFDFTSSNEDDHYWLMSYEKDTGSSSYYYYDSWTGKSTFLFDATPKFKDYKFAPMEPITYTASDGLTIHGYITFPVGMEKKNLPLVLDVHGGPAARDTWGFNQEVQWLANRGYAVLQVNYRGSTGYGKDFMLKGDREWGGKMQQDLTDAVNWAVAQGYADKSRLAIYGASYGGYAALAGATFTPDLYACSVDMFGPSNLITLVQNEPAYWKPMLQQTYRNIGDPTKDEAFMKSRSPLFSVDKIKMPILIAQGGNDPRVTPQESQQMVDAMKARGLYVDYLFFPDAGHGFGSTDERMQFYSRAEEFLGTYIGGRVTK